MALQLDPNEPEVYEIFTKAKIPIDTAKTYTKAFRENRITTESLSNMDKESLKDMGITVISDILLILKTCHIMHNTVQNEQPKLPKITAPSAKPPRVSAEMTLPQFRKFLVDWDVFKQVTRISGDQLNAQIYNCCDDEVQNTIVNSMSNFFTISEKALHDSSIVTKKSNPSFRLNFTPILQKNSERIQEFLIRLKSQAPDCAFTCTNCEHDIQPDNNKDQFIKGLNNEALQTDILAKASQLKTLEDTIAHAEAYKAAMRDQTKLHQNSDAMAAIPKEQEMAQSVPPNQNTNDKHACQGCGSHDHGEKGGSDRSDKCPAWGKTCHFCKGPNHFAKMCHRKTEEANALIAHVRYNGTHSIPYLTRKMK